MEILIIIIAEIFLFRNEIFKGALLGDACDGRLTALITEHWYQVILGNEKWNELICFYPEQNVISYSDLLLAYAPLHCLFRALELPYYDAYKYTVMLFHILGSLVLYHFLRKYIKCKKGICLFGVLAFSFSLSYQNIMLNTQCIMVSTIPIFLLLIAKYIAENRNKKRYIYGILMVLYIVILFYTSFYTLFFLGIAIIILMITWIVGSFFYKADDQIKVLHRNIFLRWKEFLAYAFACLLMMLPLLGMYLSTYNSGAGYTWDLIRYTGIDLRHLFVINTVNELRGVAGQTFITMSIPIAMAVIFAISSASAIIFEKDSFKKYLMSVILIAIILMYLAIVDINGFMGWKLIYRFVPGAKIVRMLFRWYPIVHLVSAVYMSYVLNDLLAGKEKYTLYVTELCIVCCLSNFYPKGYFSNWSEAEEKEFLESVSPPPENCEVMYISGKIDQSFWICGFISDEVLQQLNAWDIAAKYNIKTINGYSGHEPDYWRVKATGKDCELYAKEWIKQKNMDTTGLYEYNVNTKKWTPVEVH